MVLEAIDWPAWVQAIGSVAAILAAIWIDHGTTRRSEKERRRLAREEAASRLRAIRRCRETAESFKELGATFPPNHHLPAELGDMAARRLDVLNRILNRGQPRAEVLESLLLAQYEYNRLVEVVRNLHRQVEADRPAILSKGANSAIDALVVAEELLLEAEGAKPAIALA